ncbi:MAG: curli assembly protein CsgF [Flavobacteriaceae bacterium]|nr:curli assembly protein CsgF [Flavobacteriaceae bacterium]
MKKIVFLLCMFVCSYGIGQQLVYTPKNPAFGGDPFNYTWLLNSANAQNSFQDDLSGLEGLESLGDSFDNLSLGQFGINDELPEEGTSREGNFEYDVFESSEGLVINILNIVTGEQSQIIIPNN